MQSLKDKLLKAGLVTEESIKKAEVKAPISNPLPPRSAQQLVSQPKNDFKKFEPVRLPKFAPLPGSKEANRQAARAQHELDRKVRESVEANKVEIEIGASVFHFVTRKNKLRRLELTEVLHKRIEAGELAIVEWPLPDKIEHALVPVAVALELKKLSPRVVRFLKGEEVNVGFEEESVESTESLPNGESVASAESSSPNQEEPAQPTFITIKRSPI
jgi:uncharacterized protein YaiL (DUF2058 family)